VGGRREHGGYFPERGIRTDEIVFGGLAGRGSGITCGAAGFLCRGSEVEA